VCGIHRRGHRLDNVINDVKINGSSGKIKTNGIELPKGILGFESNCDPIPQSSGSRRSNLKRIISNQIFDFRDEIKIEGLFTWYKSQGSNNHPTRQDLEKSMPRGTFLPAISDLLVHVGGRLFDSS